MQVCCCCCCWWWWWWWCFLSLLSLLVLQLLLKGHSQLWGHADLDTSFSYFEKSPPQPEIKVYLKFRFNFAVFCLNFNRLLKNLFLCVLCSSYNVVFITFGYKQYGSCLCDMQISYGMVSNAHVRQLIVFL